MCCFSLPIEQVSNTKIFARGTNGSQYIVYEMSYAAKTDLAMVLPIPVPKDSAEEAVSFISLERFQYFFFGLSTGFVSTGAFEANWTASKAPRGKLEVYEVGCYEASFVPKLDDFERLDERFRIPRDIWDKIPAYVEFGFVVFKLKKTGRRRSLVQRIFGQSGSVIEQWDLHPMAFQFPRRNPDLLYFPTIHIHDRDVHPSADFDHTLYCQVGTEMEEQLTQWEVSSGPASSFMNIELSQEIIDPEQHCWRTFLKGSLENKDTTVGSDGSIPKPA